MRYMKRHRYIAVAWLLSIAMIFGTFGSFNTWGGTETPEVDKTEQAEEVSTAPATPAEPAEPETAQKQEGAAAKPEQNPPVQSEQNSPVEQEKNPAAQQEKNPPAQQEKSEAQMPEESVAVPAEDTKEGPDTKVDIRILSFVLPLPYEDENYPPHLNMDKIHLLANGKEVAEPLEIEERAPYSMGDTYTVKSLPKYDEEGQEIQYTVKVDVPEGMDVHIHQGEKSDSEYTYIISYTNKTTDVQVTIRYLNMMESVPPYSITLLQNGEVFRTEQVINTEEYPYRDYITFEDVPMYDEDGAAYEYTIDEDQLAKYALHVDNKTDYSAPYSFRFDMYGPMKGEEGTAPLVIHVACEDDRGSQSNDFTYRVYADGELFLEEHKKDVDWHYPVVFTHPVPVQENGKDIVYTVEVESNDSRFEVVHNEKLEEYTFDVLFRFNNDNVPITVTAEYVDGMPASGVPSSIRGKVYDYSNFGNVTLNRTSAGFAGVVNLPLYDSTGLPREYMIREITGVQSGYAPVSGTMVLENGTGTIPVKLVKAKDIKVTFLPDNSFTADEARGFNQAIYMNLRTNGETDKNRNDGALFVRMGIPVTIRNVATTDYDGNPVTHTISPSMPSWSDSGYTFRTEGNEEDGFVVTVSKVKDYPRVSFWVSLDYDTMQNPIPESMEFELYKNNEPTGRTLVLSDESEWEGEFLLEEGEDYTQYTVKPKELPAPFKIVYESYYDYGQKRRYTFRVDLHEYEYGIIPVSVEWEDYEANRYYYDATMITIFLNGSYGEWLEGKDGNQTVQMRTVTKIDGEEVVPELKMDVRVWHGASWYPQALASRVTARSEYDEELGGYRIYASVIGEDQAVFDFRKIWEPFSGYFDWGVGKAWPVDPYGLYIDVPQEPVEVKVYRDGVFYKTITIDAPWNPKFAFDRYDPTDGHEYKYTFEEVGVDGFTSVVSMYPQRMLVGPDGKWSEDLPYDEEWYVTTGTYRTTVANGANPTSITVSKKWDDENDQAKKRPGSILVTLFANGVPTQYTAKLSEENGWAHTFKNLPLFHAGGWPGMVCPSIIYTAYESIIEWYRHETSGDMKEGITFTNTYTGKTSIAGQKTWEDKDDAAGKRPDSITINLLANGEKVDSKTVTEKDGWKYEFTDLYTHRYGEKITYSISEEPVAGYTTTIDGYNVTNTYEETPPAEEPKLSVKKTSSVTSARVGDTIPFTITVTNDGKVDAKNIRTVDLLPEELDYVSADPAPDSIAPGEITWNMAVPAGESVEIILMAQINEKAAGKVINQVVIYDEEGERIPEEDGGKDQEEIIIEKDRTEDSVEEEEPPAINEDTPGEPAVTVKKAPGKDKSPETGDKDVPVKNLLLIAIVAAGLTLLLTRRKASERN